MPRNHYNVKFLKGYGHSVSVKNSKIILKNNYDPFSEPTSEEWFVKNMPYEKIVLQGKGYISTEALSLLSQNNRNVILLDNHGKPVTFMNGMMDSLTATKYRIGQYDTFRDESKREYLSKQIISAKKESQLKLLKIIGSNVTMLPEKEHLASKIYLKEFAKFIPEKYGFTSQQIFENKKTELMTPEIDPQYCEELEEKNSMIEKWESDQERNDVRQTLNKCQGDKESSERLNKIVFENCEQFKEEYDGKITQKVPDKNGVKLVKHTMNDCKLRK